MTTKTTKPFVLDPNNAEATAKSLCEALLRPIGSFMGQFDDPNEKICFWFFLFGGLMGMSSLAMTPLTTQAILSDLLKQHIQADASGEFIEAVRAPAH